ncbi:hypothetical protein UFOVP529_71 [uncultured Caudovirales phage]|uniref:Uncharacterized protein n=1 Tax=uncultured Caudovirales phage TaxID=2100421 RepID=A0A6J5MWG1_9CAUD|nr:hypothetical protein UFOVP529_71 [uncultured Caudovirales phage]CAB4189663.1 hypothetical protein UFOVP1191_9 [uncultured Caudovirales phage]CAB4194417.1 hypothetical protein UFOVP1252_50 [uncultured Caudovirales phage]
MSDIMVGKTDALFDRDKLVAARKGMTFEESQRHYLKTEMIDPLKGGVILGGFVDTGAGINIPVLRVMIKGKVYQVIVSMDDELNDGGRLLIDEEVSNG